MKKYIYILFLFIITFQAQAHTSHYKKISKIEMEVFRNNKLIGYSNYYFEHEKDAMTIKNYTQFKVKLLGIIIFSISSEAIEKYQDNKLVFFKSNTLQNNKEKFVNLNYNKSLNKFIIDGSSFKGEANTNSIVGNWWNHKILQTDSQISPISGSIKKQVVTFVGKEKIEQYGKVYNVDRFTLKSKDMTLPKDKRLDFNIWYDQENFQIIRVSYSRMGNWEYRLKSFE